MNYAFGRLSRQLIHGLPKGQFLRCGLQTLSPRSYPPVRAVISAGQPWTSFSTAKPDETEPEAKAKKLDQKVLDEEEQELRARQNQVKRPWHREGADEPPIDKDGKDDAPVTKGKLLTTPTRLLKLILPLPLVVEKDKDNNNKKFEYGRSISPNDKIQPLALLVHPQQPLSYVERLIQAELPPVVEDGKEKIPSVYFRAEDTKHSDNKPTTRSEARRKDEENKNSHNESPTHVAAYSGLGHEGPERDKLDKNWVRWSNSTEMGDFIRDAASGREFAVEIEGYHVEMRVSVPSFGDRTYYMRAQLQKMSRQITELSQIKREDLVEPVTYLAGLATIMGGYLWFLYISKDLSYKAAMNVTVSRRQNALYEARGFDPHKWEQLVQEANALRREIKVVAVEYDVDWDEARDIGDNAKEVLNEERTKAGDKARSEEKEKDEEFTDKERKKKDSDESEEKDKERS
ncbi:hypothetical protein N0V88_007221 [Collariella sp. IMI 366227]|nr:hypothetical protein N0V88_007221 [Collariella sp. IMI 366227]